MNPRVGEAAGAGATPFLLAADSAELFCLHHAPVGAAVGAVVCVPPFCEEMNKSRRMLALQSRALAARGWHVLQLDLRGTGDSPGDFGDAHWQGWLADVAAARSWLRDASGHEPWLWGVRLGALLAAISLSERSGPGLLAWQAVLSGRQHLQQFLRLQAGADWVGGDTGAGRANLKPMEALMQGQPIEVAGYRLAPALALPLSAAALVWPTDLARLVWLEVSPHDDAALSPAAERWLAQAPAGLQVSRRVVRGASFWQTQEIEVVPALLDASCEEMAA